MAQATGTRTFKDAQIAISTNGTAWTDITGWHSQVNVTGGGRMTGEKYTGDSNYAVIGAGKTQPLKVEATILYTEGATDPYPVLEAYKLANPAQDIYVRATPFGNVTAGTSRTKYTYAQGPITDLLPPSGDMSKADPLEVKFTVMSPSYTTSTSTTTTA